MDIYVIILRLLHILAGVFWVGAIWMMVGFLMPTAQASAPEGPKFIQRLMQSRLPKVLSAAAGTNILAGLLLYWRYTGGFNLNLITTAAGLSFTIGGVAAIIAFVLGFTVSKSAADRLGALGKEIQASGQPPTPEQAAEMKRLQARLSIGAKWTAALLTIALIEMAIARYV
jgi:hypothetical protein